jgi:hypothetical protein
MDIAGKIPNPVLYKCPEIIRKVWYIFGLKVYLGILYNTRHDAENVLNAG